MTEVSQALFQVSGVSHRYALGQVSVHALQDVSLELAQGELVCLAGPSGSGKSTLLRLLGLIEVLEQGDIRLSGTSLRTLSESKKDAVRREKLGFIFQQFLLFETLTALENVEYFLKGRGLSPRQKRARAQQALTEVGLGDQLHKFPNQMSGGQRQRVAIARAVAKEPAVILADEPTASLDQATGRQVMQLFKDLVELRGLSVIFASHDPMAMEFATRIVRLKDGKIEQSEDPKSDTWSTTLPKYTTQREPELHS